jgi:Protein of unknown function (DUF1524)
LQLPTKNSNKKKLAQYILGQLEADASGKKVAPSSFTIEHILPESFSGNWSTEFNSEQWLKSVYRLGNLTLLEPLLNRSLGQKGYLEKQQVYHQSLYSLTIAIAAVEWTPEIIAARQAELADRAVQIWRLDY